MFKFKFNKPFYKNFDTLYFIKNNNIVYYDNSHTNYIYTIKTKDNEPNNNLNIENNNEIEYTFYGFFKDDFFVIIFDSYNKSLNTNIEHKQVVLIKLKWILNTNEYFETDIYKEVDLSTNSDEYNNTDNKKKSLWEIDSSINYKNIDAFVLNIRKKILKDNFIKIDDFIKIYEYKNFLLKINFINIIDSNSDNNNDDDDNINNEEYNKKNYKKTLFSLPKFLQCSFFLNSDS
jgi:hypothetical protein